MYEDKFNDFDLEFRSLLADAEEEVPSRVWDAVNGRLGQSARIVALRWRRAVAGVAAAAAVIVMGVLIFGHSSEPELNPGSMVAAADPSITGSYAIEYKTGKETVPAIEEQLESSGERLARHYGQKNTACEAFTKEDASLADDMASLPEDHSAPTGNTERVGTSAHERAGKEAGTAKAGEEKEKSMDEIWTDPFSGGQASTSRKARGLDWKLGGNISSNEATLSKQTKRALPQAAPSATGIYNEGKSTYFVPVSFGLGVRYHFTDRFSIGTGLEYTLLSRSFTGRYIKVSGSGYEKDITTQIQNNLHYAGIPLNVYYDIISSSRVSLYTYAGALAEKGIANVYSLSDRGSVIRHIEKMNGLQWSVTAGLGVQYAITDRLGLYLDPRAEYYFDCGQPASVRTVQPLMFNFEVGLRLNL